MSEDSYHQRVLKLLEKWPAEAISQAVNLIHDAALSGNFIYLIGNGGSAATASHLATDLGVGSLKKKHPVRAISLTDNNAVVTASANDFGYEQIFSRQIQLLACEGDVVIAISASGNSKNLIRGVERAREMGCKAIGMTAFNGGDLKPLVDISLHIETAIGEYGPAEDIHSMMSHSISEQIRMRNYLE